MDNVAIYLRKSREDEELKEETLTRHETMLKDYCKRHNLFIERVYREVVSGENIANRPEMQRLLEDVSAGMYSGVVCVEIERLSRGNPIDQCEILEVFKESETKIYTLNKTYDLSTEEIDEEYFEFALFMSRREYKTIKRRMQRGRIQATKDGFFTGGIIPYGFTKERVDGGFILKPHFQESQIVRLIFNMFLNGKGTHQIASYLNEKGIKTRHGKTFQDYTILALLGNRNYIGEVRSSKLNAWVPGKHDGIIHPVVFERAQVLKDQTATKVRHSKELKNPLATFTRCGVCGYVMHRRVNRGGVEYLTCNRTGCTNRSTKLAQVESALMDELRKELDGFNHFLLNYEGEMKEKRKNRENELELLQRELAKRSEMLSRACEMLETGIYSIELYKARTTAIKADMAHIEERMEEIKSAEDNQDKNARSAIPKIESVLRKYDTLSVKNKNILLKSIIESVEYTRVGDDVTLNVSLLV